MAACDKPEENPAPPQRSGAARIAPARNETPSTAFGKLLARLADAPPGSQSTLLARNIDSVPDNQLGNILEDIGSREKGPSQTDLLTTLYEETMIRPPITRLPLALEIARHPGTEPSVRATIMAELGTVLQAEHGTSWTDWALALEEHLANTEGLIRVPR